MKSQKVINQVLKYIDVHLQEKLTTKQIAEYAGYSEYHFIRIFKEHMDMTIMEYVNRRRLIKASEDIIDGTKIIDTAFKYGWQSHGGFTKAFKKEFGFSPSILRVMVIGLGSLGGSMMNHVFLESTKVGATKEELFVILKEKMKENGVTLEEERLIKIYERACNAYAGVRRYSGEEYVTHLINVAIILAELGAEIDIICAGMFCDVEKKGIVSLESLREDLPKEIFDIVAKVQIADVSEEAVVLIKLAERLHNMRTIEFMEESKKQKKAQETIEQFMPLARKLNNKKLIDELQDLSVKYYN